MLKISFVFLLFSSGFVACGTAGSINSPDGNITDETDTDADGTPDLSDNCPEVINADQSDSNKNGTGDACEGDDTDGDGISDGGDNCPDVYNSGQGDTDDDGTGDACDDSDSDDDGISDGSDNCPDRSNSSQSDMDGDDIGDECDDDVDGDGYSTTQGDCDDSDASFSPAMDETADGVDNDCDGVIDDETDGYDDDGDGYSEDDGDCDDANATVYPGAVEVEDGVDNDCDDIADEGTPNNDDRDEYTEDDGDCDDDDATVYPDATELEDGLDNDCDGDVDEGTRVSDDDGDGYCESGCIDGSVEGDCDDDDAGVHPGVEETFDFEDSNCDGVADEDFDPANSNSVLSGENNYDEFGAVIANLGDLDGDGNDDFAVSAPKNNAGGTNAGKIYIFYGSDSLSSAIDASNADLILTGENANDEAGYSLANAGDVDGDGRNDLLVGAYKNDETASNAGKVYLIYGSLIESQARGATLDLSAASVSIRGQFSDDHLGSSVSGNGDINGDGCSDILLGADGYDNGAYLSAGKVYLIYGHGSSCDPSFSNVLSGSYTVSSIANATFSGRGSGHYLGYSVLANVDLDGDEYDDIIMGAYGYGSSKGRIYVIYGSNTELSGVVSLTTYSDSTFDGSSSGDTLGMRLSNAGDFNGDGIEDLLVSGYGSDTAGTDSGSVSLVIGDSARPMTLSAIATFSGEDDSNQLGYGLGAGGDVNGDGYSDILLGANLNSETDTYAGKAYLVSGSDDPASVSLNDLLASFLGTAERYYTGSAVDNSADINGDGNADMLIGAPQSNLNNTGRVYLLLGVD